MKDKPLKLAIIYTDLSLGGIQRKIIDLLNYLYKHNLSKKIDSEVILRWKTDFDLTSNLDSNKHKIFYPPRIFPFPRRRMSFGFNIFLRFFLNPPDIILTHVFSSSMRSIPMARLFFGKKVRIVVSQDNIFSYENNQWYARLLVSFIYNLADAIIVQTNISKKDLVENWSILSSRVFVIPNWSRKMISSRRKNESKDIDLIYTGRFEDQKNLLRLLRICKTLVKKRPTLKVFLIGSGRQKKILNDFVKNNKLNKNVFFIAPTNNIESYLNRAKIFALTSKFEGQPMALLEAMSCGCIPIAIDFPGVNEYIKHNLDGLLAKSNQEFIDSVLKCLSSKNLRNKLSVNAKNTVINNYSENNIQKYINLLLN